MDYSPQSHAALQNLKTLLLLEIQLLWGCDVEWSVPAPPDSAVADTPFLSIAGEGADADDSSVDGGPSGGAASPRSMRPRCGWEATATPPHAAGPPSRGSNGGGAAAPDTGAAAAAIGAAAAPPAEAAPVPRGSRKDEAAQGASRKRSASAPVKPNKRFAHHTLTILYLLRSLLLLCQLCKLNSIIHIIYV
jgi:hypothetical protein